jgi:3-phosphoshikimate 1-carboxyvinyltransferase
MAKIVQISAGPVCGKIAAPASKSYTIRALVCAALAAGKSRLISPLTADDPLVCSRVLQRLGIAVHADTNTGEWAIHGGRFDTHDGELDCGESAATMRFVTALCAHIPGRHQLTGKPSLLRRPIRPLVDALKQLGVTCFLNGDSPPMAITGGAVRGGEVSLPGHFSSQFVSALLLLAPCALAPVSLHVSTPLASASYVAMTIECLRRFGVTVKASDDLQKFHIVPQSYRPSDYLVEGDWSSAAFLLTLGALAGDITVSGLNRQSLQGDRRIVDFLMHMGAQVSLTPDAVRVCQARLTAIDADFSDCIDLLPVMAVAAAMAKGESRFTGIARARLKESDRVAGVCEGLTRMGVAVQVTAQEMTIVGGKPHNAESDSHGDHRLAMAFAVLGCAACGTVITDAACVDKTLPAFWHILQRLGRIEPA